MSEPTTNGLLSVCVFCGSEMGTKPEYREAAACEYLASTPSLLYLTINPIAVSTGKGTRRTRPAARIWGRLEWSNGCGIR